MKFFRKVSNFLKENKMIKKKVSVRRCNLRDGLDGQCEFKNDAFFIKINKNLPENHAVDVLIHEIAHAIAWNKDKDDHGLNWGKAYSKIYRLFIETFIQ